MYLLQKIIFRPKLTNEIIIKVHLYLNLGWSLRAFIFKTERTLCLKRENRNNKRIVHQTLVVFSNY